MCWAEDRNKTKQNKTITKRSEGELVKLNNNDVLSFGASFLYMHFHVRSCFVFVECLCYDVFFCFVLCALVFRLYLFFRRCDLCVCVYQVLREVSRNGSASGSMCKRT